MQISIFRPSRGRLFFAFLSGIFVTRSFWVPSEPSLITADKKTPTTIIDQSPPQEELNVCSMHIKWSTSTNALAVTQTAYNPLDNNVYPHHPVFSLLDVNKPVVFDPDNIIEETGLKVPYQFDCAEFDGQPYYIAVPSRWTRCFKHDALKKSSMRSFFIEYPLIDEEYVEAVAVYTAVFSAPRGATFRVVEMGARWGTWGSRAFMFAQKVRPDLKVELLFYEPNEVAANGLREVMRINNITSYHLVQDFASANHTIQYTSSWDAIDILDVDIQGGEGEVIPMLLETLKQKAKRVIIGTHSHFVHSQMIALFSENEWMSMSNMPFSPSINCVSKFLRKTVNNFPGGWSKVLENKCFHMTHDYGPVSQWDGELIFDNLKFQQGPEPHCKMVL